MLRSEIYNYGQPATSQAEQSSAAGNEKTYGNVRPVAIYGAQQQWDARVGGYVPVPVQIGTRYFQEIYTKTREVEVTPVNRKDWNGHQWVDVFTGEYQPLAEQQESKAEEIKKQLAKKPLENLHKEHRIWEWQNQDSKWRWLQLLDPKQAKELWEQRLKTEEDFNEWQMDNQGQTWSEWSNQRQQQPDQTATRH
jgi:hypothetical protein